MKRRLAIWMYTRAIRLEPGIADAFVKQIAQRTLEEFQRQQAELQGLARQQDLQQQALHGYQQRAANTAPWQ